MDNSGQQAGWLLLLGRAGHIALGVVRVVFTIARACMRLLGTLVRRLPEPTRSREPLRALGAAAALFLAICVVVATTVDHEGRLYQFVFERSYIQLVTLFVACQIAALTFRRMARYRLDRAGVEAAEVDPDASPAEIMESVRDVCATRRTHGNVAALAHTERIAKDREKRIHKSYANINYLAGCLPALGLFGTMLGMSNALFAAFGEGSLGPQSVQRFVASLSTAMDTTVLAMTCAAPLFAWLWLLERFDNELTERYADHVRNRLGLEHVLHEDKTVDALRTELRSLAGAIADEAHSSFESVLKKAVQTYQEGLGEAIRAIHQQERARDIEMVQRIATQTRTHLAEAVENVAARVQEHNSHTAGEVARQVAQLEQALRNRTPEEVIIRYQHPSATRGNGRVNLNRRTNGKEWTNV